MATRTEPREDDALSLDAFLCFSIYSAGHAFNQLYRPMLDAIGLTYPQYLVMVVLWSGDDRTVKAVGTALHLESSTLTPLLKRLEGLGLLTRTRDPADERQVRLKLTPEGRALRERAASIPECVLDATGTSREELERLTAELGALRNRLIARRG